MPKSKEFQIGGVNIVLHPHSTDRYITLWQRIYSLEKVVHVWGDTYAIVGTIDQVDHNNPEAGFVGSIFKFTKIDKGTDWLDLRNSRPAKPEVVSQEVKIPDYLQPNLRLYQYFFDVKHHKIVVETHNRQGNFSPSNFETMIQNLVLQPEIKKEFPGAEVTVEQSKEVLKTILKTGGLKYLRILVKRPNPDGSANDEKKVLNELSSQRASRTVVELYAETDKVLEPDERTRLLARVATSNGFVEGEAINENGQLVPMSSRDQPHREPFSVEPKQTMRSSFLSAARKFIKNLAT